MKIILIGSEGAVGQLFSKVFYKNEVEFVGVDVNEVPVGDYGYQQANITDLDEVGLRRLIAEFDVVGLCTPTPLSVQLIKRLCSVDLERKLVFDVSSVKYEVMDGFSKLSPGVEVLSLHPMFGPNLSPVGKNLTYVTRNKKQLTQKIVKMIELSGMNCWEVGEAEHDNNCTLTISLNHIISFIIANSYKWAGATLSDIEPFKTPPHYIYQILASRVILNGKQTSVNIQMEDKNLPVLLESLIEFLSGYRKALLERDISLVEREFEKIERLLGDDANGLFEKSKEVISSANG